MSQSKHRSYQAGDEPVTGYQLREFLGRGGFGEVWKVSGPGGVSAAMKIIHDLDRKRGGKELKALHLLRDIRHPNLVPLTAFWLKSDDGETLSADSLGDFDSLASVPVDSRCTMQVQTKLANSAATVTSNLPAELVIVMGLAEKSLFDRLRECTDEGWSGVPQEELLTYLEDAARAIDLLNTKHDIQHCDIKPQNILLLGGAAQVCDFGLAKMIGEVRQTSMGAGTIAYGAPEILLGKGPTATTDQYSLAISYVELRIGQLPFASENISDVLSAKQHGTIDLSLLSPGEREVIARATAIDPGQRFDTCGEMVRALRACSNAGGQSAIRSGRPRALVDTVLGRTTTSVPMVAPRRGWKSAIAGLLAAGTVLGSAAWFWSTYAALQTDDRSTHATLDATERALAAAEAALDRVTHLSQERQEVVPAAAAMPTGSTAEPAKRGEAEVCQPATPVVVGESAATPANQQPPPHTESGAPDSIPLVEAPLQANPLEEAARPVAAATGTASDNSQAIVTAAQPTAAAEGKVDPTTKEIAQEKQPLQHTVDNARPPSTALQIPATRTPVRPVRLTAQLTDDSWVVTLKIAEAAKEIWYQVGGVGEFESTGFQDFVEQRTGSPSPKSFLTLPLDATTTSLSIKYTDMRGNERGPYELTFDPDQLRQTHGKQMLEGFPHSWISFQDSNGGQVAQLSYLMNHRYALREIRYSINSEDFAETIRLPEWSATRPHETTENAQTSIELPTGAKFVSVQLTYQDGTQSKSQRFNVPAAAAK